MISALPMRKIPSERLRLEDLDLDVESEFESQALAHSAPLPLKRTRRNFKEIIEPRGSLQGGQRTIFESKRRKLAPSKSLTIVN